MSNNWISVDEEEPPKTGELFLAGVQHKFDERRVTPILMAYSSHMEHKTKISGRWPFRKKETVAVEEKGFYVVMLTRDFTYCLHGNYAPTNSLKLWHPVPNKLPIKKPQGQVE
jgi:hypothetical protein